MHNYSLRIRSECIVSPPGRPPSEVVFFINPKSGSQIAARIFEQDRYTVAKDIDGFRYFGLSLNCNVRICNLEKDNGEAGFKFLDAKLPSHVPGDERSTDAQTPKKRIWAVACGGDGTFNWVLSQLCKHGLIQRCPLAPAPFGTGNDIARVLKWGAQIVDGDLLSFGMDGVQGCLQSLKRAIHTPFDIWQVLVKVAPGGSCRRIHGGQSKDEPLVDGCLRMPMANYFSMGIDARVQCEMEPRRTNASWLNKLVFVWRGALVYLRQLWPGSLSMSDRLERVELQDAGGQWRDMHFQGQSMIVMNIPSYGGGVRLWQQQQPDTNFAPQSFSDGLLELLSVSDLLSLALQLGFHSSRLGGVQKAAQARQLRFTFSQPFRGDGPVHVQVDGEALIISRPVSVTITRMCQAMLLRRPAIFPKLPAT